MNYPAHPLLLSLLAVTSLGWQDPAQNSPAVLLKEESICIEYTASADEGSIIIAAESETALERLEICDPDGVVILDMRAEGREALELQGIVLQAGEADLPSILAAYGEGEYVFRGRTVDGHRTYGRATLSHDLAAPPLVTYPQDDMDDVPANALTLSWVSDPTAVSYRISVEQDDMDKIAVELPAGSSDFTVPAGILSAGTETQFEIIARGATGNTTGVEVEFETQ